MPTNHREDEEIEAGGLDVDEIDNTFDDEEYVASEERVIELDDDIEDLDLDSLTALEGPDFS